MLPYRFICAAIVLPLVPFVQVTHAQCNYTAKTFSASDLLAYGSVHAMIEFDGGLVVAGTDLLPPTFSQTCSIAKWHPEDGWTKMCGDLAYVGDLEVFNNILYASTSISGVFQWNGTTWSPINSGVFSWTRALQVFDDRSGNGPALFALTSDRLYKLVSPSQWTSIATFAGTTRALAVYNDELIVAGGITSVDNLAVNRIARWDGTTWSSLGDGIANGSVYDLLVHNLNNVGLLFASGSFTSAGGKAADYIASWDGVNWKPLPTIPTFNKLRIPCMGIWDYGSGPKLHVALTREDTNSGDTWDRLYRYHHDSQEWQHLTSVSLIPNAYLHCLSSFREISTEGDTLFVGGRFSSIGGQNIYHLARLLPAPNVVIEPLPSDPLALSGITSYAAYATPAGSHLYAGGKFPEVASVSNTLVARQDNKSWQSTGQAVINSSLATVHTLKTLDLGQGPMLYAGGNFAGISPFNGPMPENIARWDGVSWYRVGIMQATVYAMATHDFGSGAALYAGTAANSFQSAAFLQFNPQTSIWQAVGGGMSGGGNFGPTVYAITTFDDGSGAALYVGGRFDFAGGVPASNIARWRGSSGGWSAVGSGFNGAVRALAVYDDGGGPSLYAAGLFLYAGEITAPRIAKWDGQQWSAVGDITTISPPNVPSIGSLTTFDDGGGVALYTSNGGRWNGEFWAITPGFGGPMLAVGEVLYGGGAFKIWEPGLNEIQISTQVLSGTAQPGTLLILGADVAHSGAVRYQWRRNGIPLHKTGGFVPVLHLLYIQNLHGAHEGTYDIVITNDCTSVTSNSFVLDLPGTCLGDVTGDNVVNLGDLLQVLQSWGACPSLASICPQDLTHDRLVNVSDLLMVLNQWGLCD